MSAPNMNASAAVSAGMTFRLPSQISTPPVANAAISVPATASSRMATMLEKNPLRCVLTPASKMIGGSRPKKSI